jgi:integrase
MEAKTINMMVDAYLVSPKFSELGESTRREYVRYLNLLKEGIGTEDPASLEPHMVARIRDNIANEGTKGKANAMVAVIGALYQWGLQLGWAKLNPADGVDKFDSDPYVPWPEWALEQYPALLPPDLKRLVDLALYTGQRISDVVTMHRKHITRIGNVWTLYVKQQKTGKELWIPLHPDLAALTKEDGWLGPKKDGGQWTVDQFHAAWGRAMVDKKGKPRPAAVLRDAGLVFHGLRKNATVHLAEVGCTTHEIASITGMSLPMIEHYTKGVRQKLLAVNAMQKVVDAKTLKASENSASEE